MAVERETIGNTGITVPIAATGVIVLAMFVLGAVRFVEPGALPAADAPWPSFGGLLLDAISIAVVLLAGASLVRASETQRELPQYRLSLKVYCASTLLGAAAAFIALLVKPGAFGQEEVFALTTPRLASLFGWVSAASMTYYAMRKQQNLESREWLIRSFALTIGAFAATRILGFAFFPLVPAELRESYPQLVLWVLAVWLPLLAVEVYLQGRKIRTPAPLALSARRRSTSAPRRWGLIIGSSIVVLLTLALFSVTALRYLLTGSTSYETTVPWPRHGLLMMHIACGSLVLFLGVYQLWTALKGRNMRVHPIVGRVYCIGVLAGAIGAGISVLYSRQPFDTPYLLVSTVPLLVSAFTWLVTTGMAYYAIRARNYEQHKRWMIRSYVLTFSAFAAIRIIGFSIVPAVPQPLWVQYSGVALWLLSIWVPVYGTDLYLEARKLRAAGSGDRERSDGLPANAPRVVQS